jgi:hypothetical protein
MFQIYISTIFEESFLLIICYDLRMDLLERLSYTLSHLSSPSFSLFYQILDPLKYLKIKYISRLSFSCLLFHIYNIFHVEIIPARLLVQHRSFIRSTLCCCCAFFSLLVESLCFFVVYCVLYCKCICGKQQGKKGRKIRSIWNGGKA